MHRCLSHCQQLIFQIQVKKKVVSLAEFERRRSEQDSRLVSSPNSEKGCPENDIECSEENNQSNSEDTDDSGATGKKVRKISQGWGGSAEPLNPVET